MLGVEDPTQMVKNRDELKSLGDITMCLNRINGHLR